MTNTIDNPFPDSHRFEQCMETLAELDRQFPTEDSRIREIRSWDDEADICIACGGELFESKTDSRKYRCKKCSRRGSYTSNTMFSHVRSTRAWFAALAFLEKGIQINPFQFHKLMKISYASAHSMFAKLDHIIDISIEESREEQAALNTVSTRTSSNEEKRHQRIISGLQAVSGSNIALLNPGRERPRTRGSLRAVQLVDPMPDTPSNPVPLPDDVATVVH